MIFALSVNPEVFLIVPLLIVTIPLLSITVANTVDNVPLFIVNSADDTGMQVVFQGNTFDLLEGTNRVPNIVIKEGESEVTFIGNGTVSIDYREGSL